MELIETAVTKTHVRMRFADKEDATAATQWLEFSVAVSHKEDPYLSELQLESLEHVHDVIGREMARLKALGGQKQ